MAGWVTQLGNFFRVKMIGIGNTRGRVDSPSLCWLSEVEAERQRASCRGSEVPSQTRGEQQSPPALPNWTPSRLISSQHSRPSSQHSRAAASSWWQGPAGASTSSSKLRSNSDWRQLDSAPHSTLCSVLGPVRLWKRFASGL